MNWVDTAAVYGLGHSEEVVGRAVRALPACRPAARLHQVRPAVRRRASVRRPRGAASSPASIRRECEASLRRLGVDRIDLYQYPLARRPATPVEPSWGAMARLQDEGKVRAVGVSNFDSALLERCEATRPRRLAAAAVHADRPRAADELLPWAEAHGTGVICYSPMKNGILTDSFTRRRASARMAADDWRRGAPDFREPALSRNLALRDALRPVAARHGATVASVAVAWTLAWPGGDRRHRRRTRPGAGGRLDRRGGAGALGRRPRRDRGGHPRDRRGFGPVRPAPLTAAASVHVVREQSLP